MKPPFRAKPMFGAASRLPAVECSWGIESLQITTGKARLIAKWLLEVAATAYIDAALHRMGRHAEEREEMIRTLAALRGPIPVWHEPGAPPEERPYLTEEGRENIWITSTYGDEPHVDFQFGRMRGQIAPSEAEEIGDSLYVCAIQADTDGGLWLGLKSLGLADQNAARILQATRSERFNLRTRVKRFERG